MTHLNEDPGTIRRWSFTFHRDLQDFRKQYGKMIIRPDMMTVQMIMIGKAEPSVTYVKAAGPNVKKDGTTGEMRLDSQWSGSYGPNWPEWVTPYVDICLARVAREVELLKMGGLL